MYILSLALNEDLNPLNPLIPLNTTNPSIKNLVVEKGINGIKGFREDSSLVSGRAGQVIETDNIDGERSGERVSSPSSTSSIATPSPPQGGTLNG